MAAHFGESMILYSESEPISIVVDGAPPTYEHGHYGRQFNIPAKKPTKVPYEAGRFILDHLGYTGVVRVEVTESDTGTKYDVAKAKQESIDKLKDGDELRFKFWLSGVIEDYVKRSKPVPKPDDTIMRIIERRGYDLRQYGIVPIGWREAESQKESEALHAQIKTLQDQVAKLQQAKGAGKD